MGKVIIQEETTKKPITLIGREAGECYGADTNSEERNYKRGLDCIETNHGRTWEFPDVYMILDGYSARVIREWYTHIGGSPTRLQASTRYINYQKGFDYIIPHSVRQNEATAQIYKNLMQSINQSLKELEALNIPREDFALALPLGMTTRIACKHNFRNLADMSKQRMCSRAYWEYRELFYDVGEALKNYSPEWLYLVEHCFMPKCEWFGFCPEKKSCGRKPKKEQLC